MRHYLGYILFGWMISTAALTWWFKEMGEPLPVSQQPNLNQMLPTAFSGWSQTYQSLLSIVSPEKIKEIYTQTVDRIYQSKKYSQQVMVSVAYGGDQSDGMQLHKPEICYPAQGYQIHSQQKGVLKISDFSIPVHRLITQPNFPSQQREYVTYWVRVGEKVVEGGLSFKWQQMQSKFHGTLADGLIFRVSTLGPKGHPENFHLHQIFVNELWSTLSPEQRSVFLGKESS